MLSGNVIFYIHVTTARNMSIDDLLLEGVRNKLIFFWKDYCMTPVCLCVVVLYKGGAN